MKPEEKQLLEENIRVTNELKNKLDLFMQEYYRLNFPSQMIVEKDLVVSGDILFGKDNKSKVGLYGKTPVTQANGISAPTGGTTVDSESRTAITAVITALTNIGVLQ